MCPAWRRILGSVILYNTEGEALRRQFISMFLCQPKMTTMAAESEYRPQDPRRHVMSTQPLHRSCRGQEKQGASLLLPQRKGGAEPQRRHRRQ